MSQIRSEPLERDADSMRLFYRYSVNDDVINQITECNMINQNSLQWRNAVNSGVNAEEMMITLGTYPKIMHSGLDSHPVRAQ